MIVIETEKEIEIEAGMPMLEMTEGGIATNLTVTKGVVIKTTTMPAVASKKYASNFKRGNANLGMVACIAMIWSIAAAEVVVNMAMPGRW